MSIKQRTRPIQTSNFLEKFKGKTSTVGKDGLSGLFNRLQGKAASFCSLHQSVHFNKQNIQTFNKGASRERNKKLDQYSIEPIEIPRRDLRLPKIKTAVASENRYASHDINKWQPYTDYNHKKQDRRSFIQQLYIDDYASKFDVERFSSYSSNYSRKLTTLER